MLVKRSIVEKWYQRDSWIYKNFAYLFINSLWEKHVPNGFSVCPYFWLSMFSFFIFRPLFVAPIQYLFRPLIYLGGKPFAWLDHILYKAFDYVGLGLGLGLDEGYKRGCGFFFSLVMTVIIGMVLIGIMFCISIVLEIYTALDTTNQGVFLFWSASSFAALLGIIKIHKQITKTECKTMYYLLVWLLLFIPAIFVFIPHEAANIFGGIAVAIGYFFAEFLAWLWNCLCIISGFLWSWTKVIALWKPITFLTLPWWGFLVLLTVFGYIIDKICVYYDNKHKDYVFKTNPNEIYESYRSAWLETFTCLLVSNPYWGRSDTSLDEVTDDRYMLKAATKYRYMLYRQAIELMWKDSLDKLKMKYPSIPKSVWELATNTEYNGDTESRFSIVQDALKKDHPDFPTMNIEIFANNLIIVIKNDPGVAQLAKQYKLDDEAEKASYEAKKNSWSHHMCLKVTGKLANGFNAVGRGFKWIGINIATFFTYMWILIKAKKQGACPYFQFTGITPASHVVENNDPK